MNDKLYKGLESILQQSQVLFNQAISHARVQAAKVPDSAPEKAQLNRLLAEMEASKGDAAALAGLQARINAVIMNLNFRPDAD